MSYKFKNKLEIGDIINDRVSVKKDIEIDKLRKSVKDLTKDSNYKNK